jgi:hypothetical protein
MSSIQLDYCVIHVSNWKRLKWLIHGVHLISNDEESS